jgi:signal transduction histidine kinase
MRTPSTGVLILLAGAGLGLCGVIAWVTATGTASGDVPLEATARVLMIGLPIAVGLFAWSQPASAHFGRNLTLTGFVYFLAMLSSSADDLVHSVGRVAGWIVEVWIVYLVLSFPTGRLTLRRDHVIVALSVLVLVVLYLPTALLSDGYPTPSQWQSCVSGCPANAFQVTGSEPAFVEAWVRPLRELLTIALFLAATISLALRMRSASPLVRLATGPVLGVAAARLAIFAIALAVRAIDPGGTAAMVGAWLAGLFIPLITLAFLAGILRWRLFMGASLARLAQHTGAYTTLDELRAVLADAFRDPGLQIAERPPATAGRGRAISVILEHGQPVAAIVHDEALRDERAFKDATAARVLTTLESQRLLREVEESRARIAATADEERRRLERDLHDGAQQRLLALSYDLRMARSAADADGDVETASLLAEAIDDAQAALGELRDLAQGIHPAILTEAGLAAALATIGDAASIVVEIDETAQGRYPAAVETAAYVVVAEAIDDALLRNATRAVVTAREDDELLVVEVEDDGSDRTSALIHVADRVGAMGGRLAFEPAALRAEIPCG